MSNLRSAEPASPEALWNDATAPFSSCRTSGAPPPGACAAPAGGQPSTCSTALSSASSAAAWSSARGCPARRRRKVPDCDGLASPGAVRNGHMIEVAVLINGHLEGALRDVVPDVDMATDSALVPPGVELQAVAARGGGRAGLLPRGLLSLRHLVSTTEMWPREGRVPSGRLQQQLHTASL
eukprot:CAMPEP_0195059454 /NCGR_PEP_ID=MMETSP0448-20130528/6947_1 /TAXON_ID=66468 /ORGANISM="Heterocapsa triquestra, Strain CCMP 448" /LENGTH=180 /DNA_ID=CAMNT_0040089735 /DNA_START=180 /DNA_END=721 /DNA_ORIENTATION=+